MAYLMLAMPIESKNPTQLVCEALRERFDVEYERKALSGLTPHEWHAQVVFIVKLMERTLSDRVGFTFCGFSMGRAWKAPKALALSPSG